MEDFILDGSTLAKLKQNVESKLSEKPAVRKSQVQSKAFKPEKNSKPKPDLKRVDDSQRSTIKEHDLTQGKPSSKKRSSNGKLKSQDGKARTPEAEAKGRSSASASVREGRTKASAAKKARRASGQLKDEVFALGGNEDDLKLVEALDSGSEIEEVWTGMPDKALKKDLASFMKGLQFEKSRAEEPEASTDDEDFGVAEDDEGEDFEEDEDEDDQTRPSVSQSKEPLRMLATSDKLLIQPQSEWHNIELPSLPSGPSTKLSEKAIQELHNYGKQLLDQENRSYAKVNAGSSSHKFYSEMMTSGTLTDKISALTLSVQESPIHNRQPLDNLVALAKKRSRSQAVQVLGALKDLFGAGALLPADRRLRYFATQPGLTRLPVKIFGNWNRSQALPQPLLKDHLVLWVFEDWLKSTYFEIIKVLEVWSNDQITFARLKSVDYVYDLLKEKPEQETNLLRLLVDKLGDPDKQVASRVSSHLVQLQIPHPFMKLVVVSGIEANILFKPGATWHAKYYAIITLNQTVLSVNQQDVVKKLLDIYFAMFTVILGDQKTSNEPIVKQDLKNRKSSKTQPQNDDGEQKKISAKSRKPIASDAELKEKITSGILTGINRAFPYAASNDDFFEKKLDTLFKITHSSNFNTSIQALMLLQQLCSTQPAASDRFYRTLYESLLDPRLLTTSKHALYINLLYRAVKADTNVKRVQGFVKRLGQVTPMHQPPFVCAVIYLIKDLEETFPSLHSLIDQPEAYESDDEGTSNVIPAHVYDGRKRDPQFSNADRCCLWEMEPLITHFHPSVSLFVSKLLNKQKIEAKPDLSLHTLINFLDRFVYRNPKKITDALKGVSLMQPMASANTADMLISGRASGKRKGPALNTVDFARMQNDKVQADEVFFHKYFSAKEQGKEIAAKKKEKKQKTSEMDSEDDAEDEDEIWKALVDSRPELGDEEDEFDEDGDLSDLQMDEDDEENEELIAGEDELDLEDEDADAFFNSDDEIELSDEELEEVPDAQSAEHTKKRKLLKDLPVFASADDYTKMLQDENEDM